MDSDDLILDDTIKKAASSTVTSNMLALRAQAVLNLHYPVEVDDVEGLGGMCAECGKQSPCPTVDMLIKGQVMKRG